MRQLSTRKCSHLPRWCGLYTLYNKAIVSKKSTPKRWYPISFLGGLLLGLYALVPPYLVYVDELSLLTPNARALAIVGMFSMVFLMIVCRKTNQRPFLRKERVQKHTSDAGFTLIELLMVISIIGLLAAMIYPSIQAAKNKAYLSRSKEEFHSIAVALEMYATDHGGYPADADRDLPPGLQVYLSSGNWPKAPWPNSVYDWDAWAPANLSYPPYAQVYQISVRFCPLGQPTQCTFPNEPWAQNFDYYSAVYWCVSGPCRAHSSQPVSHAGYCINC